MSSLKLIFGLCFLFLVTACSDASFSPMSEKGMDDIFSQKEVFFPLNYSEASFEQLETLQNEVTVLAQVKQQGLGLSELQKSDFVLKENGVEITDYKLSKESSKKDQVVDIVFVVDVTGTMTQFIETAKVRLRQFILNSRAQGYHTRMCLSTFGDYTVKKCDRFFDNDPNDSSTLVQTDELISELAKLRAFKGPGQDPGWPDLDENPMRALIDATKSPWRSDAQKFVILVTDAGFLYSPDNQGQIGDLAPKMSEVTQALVSSQATVFGVTPELPGYTSPFQGELGFVKQSQGEHFLFSDVISGKVTLDQIFSRIMDRINSTYRLSYVVDQIPELDPTQPISQKSVSLVVKNSQVGEVEDVKLSATFPDGRPAYKTQWALSSETMGVSDVEVYVNDLLASPSSYQVVNHILKFKKAPAPSAKIKARFLYKDEYANLKLEPVVLSLKKSLEEHVIRLNGITARPEDLLIEKTVDGKTSFTILRSVFKDDYYQIKNKQGILFSVQ